MQRGHNKSQGKCGTSLGSHMLPLGDIINAKMALHNHYTKFKRMTHWRRQLTQMHISSGHDLEVRYVLMDYEQNKQLKSRMMTRLEAWNRNESLKGTGFAWAICGK